MLVPTCEIMENNKVQLLKQVKSVMRELTKGYIKTTDSTKRTLQAFCNFVDVAHDAALWVKFPNQTNTKAHKFVVHAAQWFQYLWDSKTWRNVSICAITRRPVFQCPVPLSSWVWPLKLALPKQNDVNTFFQIMCTQCLLVDGHAKT